MLSLFVITCSNSRSPLYNLGESVAQLVGRRTSDQGVWDSATNLINLQSWPGVFGDFLIPHTVPLCNRIDCVRVHI